MRLMSCEDLQDLPSAHKRRAEASSRQDKPERKSHWTESIAVGSKSYIEEVKKSLGFKTKVRSIAGRNDRYRLRDDVFAFGRTSLPGPDLRIDRDTNHAFVWSDIA